MRKEGGSERLREGRSGRDHKKATTSLLSDQPTLELVIKARTGDERALNALLQRCLPPLTRWAHGRLPAVARGHLDTVDLVQVAAMRAIAKLGTFEPRHVGAMQAYLRRAVINQIRDEMRRVARRPVPAELPEELASDDATPQELAIVREEYQRYQATLKELRPKDRELVVARIEAQWTLEEIKQQFGYPTREATRMALSRALNRLKKALEAS